MSEAIVTKTCSKCKQVKPLDSFGIKKGTSDGLTFRCKTCNEYMRYYKQTEKNQRWREQYKQSGKALACSRKRDRSDRGKQSRRDFHGRHPERRKAREAIKRAVDKGLLPPAKSCICQCGKAAAEYHHESYAPEDRLVVIPVCIQCHRSLRSLPSVDKSGI